MAESEGVTDEQKRWAAEALQRVGVEHGDWLVLQGAQAAKRDAMADAVQAVLAEHDARCQLLCVPPGISVRLVPGERMAQKFRWQPKGVDPNALMKRPVPSGRTSDLQVRDPILRITRLRPQDGDAIVVTSPPDQSGPRGSVAEGIREALDRQGLSCLVLNVDRGTDLGDLPESMMMDAGWTRIERKAA